MDIRPEDKTWYDPDDFLDKYGRLDPHSKFFKKIQIKDPIKAIVLAHETLLQHPDKLEALSKKICEFSVRVARYYRDRKR